MCEYVTVYVLVFFFKQKTAYEMRISDWSSDVCSSDLLKDFLEQSPGEAFVVVEADDLPVRSALRKLFEADRNAAALACYHDDARSLETVVRAFFSEAGVGISREAVAFLASQLGGDRELTRRELEKVLLFAGDGERSEEHTSELQSLMRISYAVF